MEVEESNDQARVRKVRLERGIRKMRLERAFLLDQLAKRMRKNPHILGPDGLEEEESEDSSEGPPTVSAGAISMDFVKQYADETSLILIEKLARSEDDQTSHAILKNDLH